MPGGSGSGDSRSLEQTPTWAVPAVFVVISILIEQAIHLVGHWLRKHNKKALNEALEKIKAEFMLLGFSSLLLLLLTSGEILMAKLKQPIEKSVTVLKEKLPYHFGVAATIEKRAIVGDLKGDSQPEFVLYSKNRMGKRMIDMYINKIGRFNAPLQEKNSEDMEVSSEGHHRRLLWGLGGAAMYTSSSELPLRRFLAGGGSAEHCANKVRERFLLSPKMAYTSSTFSSSYW
eukprot:Gb_32378 [translate_table: standard]